MADLAAIKYTLLIFSSITLCLILWNNKYTTINDTLQILCNNNTKHESCNPTYIVWEKHGRYHLSDLHLSSYSQYGFNINCSIDSNDTSPSATFGRTILREYHVRKRICQTYNHSHLHSHSNPFCNGGRIYHMAMPDFLSNLFYKYKLNLMLTEYCDKYHINDTVCNFKPLTFNMDNQTQRIEFLSKYIECTNNKPQPNKTWVFKEDKHRGSGVHFYNNHELIYRLLTPDITEQNTYFNNCKGISPLKHKRYFKKEGFTFHKTFLRDGFKVSYDHLVLQEFISNPLLIENKAFHLRIFGLIPSFYKPFIALYFRQGIIYRTPEEYNNVNLNKNKLRTNGHVTDDSTKMNVNKTWFKRRWGFYKFQNWLTEEFGNDMLNYTRDKLNNDIKHITHHVFKANHFYNKLHNFKTNKSKQRLFNGNIETSVSIYCMDFIITDKFELKLLETNFFCGICCSGWDDCDRVLDNDGHKWMCRQFAKESTAISLEMHTKKSYNTSIDTIQSLNQFEIAFWSND